MNTILQGVKYDAKNDCYRFKFNITEKTLRLAGDVVLEKWQAVLIRVSKNISDHCY